LVSGPHGAPPLPPLPPVPPPAPLEELAVDELAPPPVPEPFAPPPHPAASSTASASPAARIHRVRMRRRLHDHAALRRGRAPFVNSSTIFAQNAGKSSGLRLVVIPSWVTTSSSTHSAPALRRSVRSEGHDVTRRPRTASASTSPAASPASRRRRA